ncbi:hypothetical protein ACFSTC_48725 [Nonomuraea ferruginea]
MPLVRAASYVLSLPYGERRQHVAALRAAAARAAGPRRGDVGECRGGAGRQLLVVRLAGEAAQAAGGRAGLPLPAGGAGRVLPRAVGVRGSPTR